MPLDEIIEASIDKDKAPEPTGGATTEPEKPASTARPDLDPARKRTQKLHVAAMLDKREEIESLLSSGEVDVDAADVAHGFTALTTAARYGHVDLCRYLLAKGANPLHKDNEGRTILEFAQFANTQLPEELPALLSSALPRRIKVLSWNIAAINLNPFEYWMTHPDPAYTKMMEDVEAVMMSPGEADVPVAEVFTQAMFDELQVLMGKEGWPCEAECAEAYKELATRPIVSGFLKDKDLGSKRLMSMPDRMTNTIDTADGKPTCRPTVISSFAGDMGTVENWWPLWSAFLFQDAVSIPGKKGADPSSKRPCELLSPIPRAKYPALSEAEEAMSLRLQTVCLAVFDAVLVHLLKSLMEPKAEEEEKAAEGEKAADAAEVPKRPQQPSKWVQLKKGILAALVTAKEPRITQMLKKTHRGAQIIFLQEVRGKMASEALPSALEDYAVLSPATPSKAEQNSLILIEKGFFDASTVVDLSAEAMAACAAAGGTLPSAGDLLVVSVAAVDGSRFLLASFHGDTDGLATANALAAVAALAAARPDHKIISGLDANTYVKAKEGKQAGVAAFAKDFASKGLASCWGEQDWANPQSECYTTFTARTFLQPQLQKACKSAKKMESGDYNPKDFILFSSSAYKCLARGQDNTGTAKFKPELVLPSLHFPSDHGLIWARLDVTSPPTAD